PPPAGVRILSSKFFTTSPRNAWRPLDRAAGAVWTKDFETCRHLLERPPGAGTLLEALEQTPVLGLVRAKRSFVSLARKA
ncbi:MAG TPA: hypothetical protein VMK12_20895, partial [Anaeromyxobacteraceae bacterium]|nr:hypothetical protein [Anaeromyxobacteraceae bacterium]